MSDVKLSNKEEIEKFLSDIRGIEVKINRIQQKKNCLVVSDAGAKTELHTYKDDQKPTAEGYESHAFIYIIPINNGKYSPDIVTIGAESHEIWGDVYRGEYMYMIDNGIHHMQQQ